VLRHLPYRFFRTCGFQLHAATGHRQVFVQRDKLLACYRDCPQLIINTERLLGECSFDYTFKESKNKKTFTGNRYDDKQLLQKYAMD